MSEWQPIETAPKDGTEVLAANRDHDYFGMVRFNEQGEWESLGFNFMRLRIGFYPTHWMPMPEPPK